MKDNHVVGKKMALHGRKMAFYQLLFFWSRNLSFVKDERTNDKKWPEMVVTQSFIKGHSFPITI